MLSSGEILAALRGSWLLFCNRPEGKRYFDMSLDGFWRSFRVIFLLLPFLAISGHAQWQLIVEENDLPAEAFDLGGYWLSEVTALVVDWISLPLVLAGLAGVMGISRTYVPFIVVRNWASLLSNTPFAIVSLLYLMGAIPPGILILLTISALLVVLWFHYRIARHVLEVGAAVAVGIVLLDGLLTLVLGELISRFWGL